MNVRETGASQIIDRVLELVADFLQTRLNWAGLATSFFFGFKN